MPGVRCPRLSAGHPCSTATASSKHCSLAPVVRCLLLTGARSAAPRALHQPVDRYRRPARCAIRAGVGLPHLPPHQCRQQGGVHKLPHAAPRPLSGACKGGAGGLWCCTKSAATSNCTSWAAGAAYGWQLRAAALASSRHLPLAVRHWSALHSSPHQRSLVAFVLPGPAGVLG